MSGENDAGTSNNTQENDQVKGKSPPMSEEDQEKVGKKSGGDMSESVKALVKATMTEELAKFKAGLKSGTQPPTPSGPFNDVGVLGTSLISNMNSYLHAHWL